MFVLSRWPAHSSGFYTVWYCCGLEILGVGEGGGLEKVLCVRKHSELIYLSQIGIRRIKFDLVHS